MLKLKTLLWTPLLLLFLASCSMSSTKRSYYPEEVSGERVAFYTLKSELPGNENFVEKDYLYIFNRDGSYQGTVDGMLHELGNHSYRLDKRSNQAHLLLQQSNRKNPHTYTINMTYDSAYAGTWEINWPATDGEEESKEVGTFRFIK